MLTFHFSDTRNLLSKLTFRKVMNALRVVFTYYYSKNTKKVKKSGLPFSIAFEPTTSCNLRCPECPSGLRSFTRPTGMLDIGFFKKKIDEIKDHLRVILTMAGVSLYLNLAKVT